MKRWLLSVLVMLSMGGCTSTSYWRAPGDGVTVECERTWWFAVVAWGTYGCSGSTLAAAGYRRVEKPTDVTVKKLQVAQPQLRPAQ